MMKIIKIDNHLFQEFHNDSKGGECSSASSYGGSSKKLPGLLKSIGYSGSDLTQNRQKKNKMSLSIHISNFKEDVGENKSMRKNDFVLKDGKSGIESEEGGEDISAYHNDYCSQCKEVGQNRRDMHYPYLGESVGEGAREIDHFISQHMNNTGLIVLNLESLKFRDYLVDYKEYINGYKSCIEKKSIPLAEEVNFLINLMRSSYDHISISEKFLCLSKMAVIFGNVGFNPNNFNKSFSFIKEESAAMISAIQSSYNNMSISEKFFHLSKLAVFLSKDEEMQKDIKEEWSSLEKKNGLGMWIKSWANREEGKIKSIFNDIFGADYIKENFSPIENILDLKNILLSLKK